MGGRQEGLADIASSLGAHTGRRAQVRSVVITFVVRSLFKPDRGTGPLLSVDPWFAITPQLIV